jgi:hypothetical protein
VWLRTAKAGSSSGHGRKFEQEAPPLSKQVSGWGRGDYRQRQTLPQHERLENISKQISEKTSWSIYSNRIKLTFNQKLSKKKKKKKRLGRTFLTHQRKKSTKMNSQL